MKYNICQHMKPFFIVIMLFAHMMSGMYVATQWSKKQVVRRPLGSHLSHEQRMALWSNLSKKYPYLQYSQSKDMQPYSGPTIEDFDVEPSQIHLVPTDMDTLKLLDLCPLFEKPEAIIDKDLAASLNESDIKIIFEMQIAEKMPKYHIFKDLAFEIRHTDLNVPCIVPLGNFGNWNRSLIQFKSLDQDQLAKETKLSQFLCAGHSLNNSRLIRNYVLDGEVKYLKKLHDIQESVGFLLDLGISEWPDVARVKEEIKNVGKLLDVNNIEKDISAVSTIVLFGSEVGSMDRLEFDYAQNVKKKIQEGLKQENYVHIVIIGNEEFTVKHGHYFCFVIIKAGNEIQYLVLDTLPGVYHLQEGSHERDRLMFLIDNIEKGSSLVKVANLSVMPEFIDSVGQHDKESLLEGRLADERMQEAGEFENQIKFLNDFSKKLNQFGIKKQLEKESKEGLVKYLHVMGEISNVYGKENTYAVLRELIEKRLNEI